ncbi:IS21-like element helper ATPase IstB [Paraliomyxa miuraensis]|uniref:IS21-like element helper ATPase IstB n=1 Tax=Paraliomyxa miuraensis TaxID=376150 RepID=UPI00225B409F|nr:IS21-like element helper ATPase IstB [Paraliomyxa miuraensis]MCX4239073.1 IS21-like element helper ATPase IstB [Paraliomyxa miuraensis]
MLNEPTLDKLKELRLGAFADAWLVQQADPESASLGFDERLGLLVDAEWSARHNKRLARNLREAKLKFPNACIEDVDFPPRRQLDKTAVRQLATCKWIENHQSIVITGATGVGKTFLACALAQHAIRKNYRAAYRRLSRLFDELALARADGSYVRLLAQLARTDVLVLDDWGMTPVREAERRDLNEIMEDRWGNRSTIVTSQIPVAKWHDHIGDPTTADAVCDRILNNAQRIVLKGPSRRKQDDGDDT